MKRRIASLFTALFLLVVSTVLYASTIRGTSGNIDENQGNRLTEPGQPFESSHERAPYALVLSLDRSNSISLSKDLAEFGSPDVGIYQEKFFILFPPGVSFLIYPFYQLGYMYGYSQLAAYASIGVLSLGIVLLLYRISRKVFSLPLWASAIVSLVWAFGTTSWSYAVTIYQHIPVTFFLLLGFYAVYELRRAKYTAVFWSAVAWGSYGCGLFMDFPHVFLGFPIMVYFFLSSFNLKKIQHQTYVSLRASVLIGSLVFAALVVLHGYYNQQAFGDWKKFGQSFSRYEGDEKYELRQQRLAREATMSGIIKKSTTASNPFSIFDEDKMVRGFETLTIANDKGLFYFSPVLLLGVIAWFFRKKKAALEQGMLIAVAIVNVFLYASFGDPWGGWAYGPRYLIPAMAVLSIFVGIFLTRFIFPWIARLSFIALFLFSSGIALLGAITTNLIPPKIEGIPLGLQYNYIANIFYVFEGQTGSFLYRTWFATVVTFQQYVALLYAIIVFAVVLLLLFGSVGKQGRSVLVPEFAYLIKLLRMLGKKLGVSL